MVYLKMWLCFRILMQFIMKTQNLESILPPHCTSEHKAGVSFAAITSNPIELLLENSFGGP